MAPEDHLLRKDTLMRRHSALVCALALSVLIVSSAPSGAQGQGQGAPPFQPPPPAWTQKLACDTPSACPRFSVLGGLNNEAVLDRETGLVWERTPVVIEMDW